MPVIVALSLSLALVSVRSGEIPIVSFRDRWNYLLICLFADSRSEVKATSCQWARKYAEELPCCFRWATSSSPCCDYESSYDEKTLGMQLSFMVDLLLVLVLLLTHSPRSSFVSVQADSASCRKQVECFICDSREIQECEDVKNFSHVHIPIRLCDDYCLKIWTRDDEFLTGENRSTGGVRYVRRDCHKIYRYHIKKAETCYKHKKYHDDALCLCGSDRCNQGNLSLPPALLLASCFSLLLNFRSV